MKERHWMGAGAAMERMRRRLCINLGKMQSWERREIKQNPQVCFFIFYAISLSHTNKIFTLLHNNFSALLCCTSKGAENRHACSGPRELTWN